MSQKVVFIDTRQKDASGCNMSHSEVVMEAFFHRMHANGKLNDAQMELIEESIPGFHRRLHAKKPTF